MRFAFRWQADLDHKPVPKGLLRDGFCDQCGVRAEQDDHAPCERRRKLEPPRFCRDCGRRMVVQVTPAGWTAICSRHGERRSDDEGVDTEPDGTHPDGMRPEAEQPGSE
ncbi:MAG: hypothetical protein M3Z25_17825 [Actinomycetota bacterium]|nr:hypothetical protein [Actinomycetota bacterium]